MIEISRLLRSRARGYDFMRSTHRDSCARRKRSGSSVHGARSRRRFSCAAWTRWQPRDPDQSARQSPVRTVPEAGTGCRQEGWWRAVTATTPTDWLLTWLGWRSLFELLTIATLAVAGLIYFAVPESNEGSRRSLPSSKPLTLRSIFSDPRFLRIAPLSATCVGSSWAMHSLWAASWLADVEGFDRQGVINQLFTMAIGISLDAVMGRPSRDSQVGGCPSE